MKPDGREEPEERLAELLADYKDALAAGGPRSDSKNESTRLDPALQGRHQKNKACLRLLEQFLPRQPLTFSKLPGNKTVADPKSLPLPELGRFRVLRELGRGGFGIVYLAEDPLLRRRVALKVPRPELYLSQEIRKRFLREARMIAQLSHPHIVPVFDTGEAGDAAYIVTGYCAGGTLAEWLKKRQAPFPVRAAAQLATTLAEAVHYAHEHGILHRDLKPANVLLELPAGEEAAGHDPIENTAPNVRISDFGLAKFLEPGMSTPHGGMFDRRTTLIPQVGTTGAATQGVLGTPQYMSPEQADGRIDDIGPASDVYSLGVLLYELLTGAPPFQGTHLEVLQKVKAEEPVSPSQVRPDVPRDLEAVCLKCLEKLPERRYAAAGDLARDLRHFLADEPTRARPLTGWERARKSVRGHKTLTAFVCLCVVVSIGALCGVSWYSRVNARQALESRRLQYVKQLPEAQRAWEVGDVFTCEKLLNAQRPPMGQPDLRGFEWGYLWRQYQEEGLHFYGHTARVTAVAYAPNGLTLATASADRTVKLWDTTTGQLVRTLQGHADQVNSLAFAPDGQTLASASNDKTVKLWNPRIGRELATLTGHDSAVICVAYSPDGRLLASGSNDSTVRLWDSSTKEIHRTIRTRGPLVHAIAFAPSGDLLASLGSDVLSLWEIPGGGLRAEVQSYGQNRSPMAFSADGKWLATGCWGNRACLWDTACWEPRASIPGLGDLIFAVAFSPDSRSLAVSGEIGTNKGGQLRIWDVSQVAVDGLAVQPADGDIAFQTTAPWASLSFKRFTPSHMAFAPNGRDIAMCSGNLARLWRPKRSVDKPRPISHAPEEAWCVAFSPDGRTLVSGGDNGDLSETVKLSDVNTGKTLWTSSGHASLVSCVAIAPNGRLIATSSYDCTIKLWDATSGKLLATLNGHTKPLRCVAFSPNGNLLATGGKDAVIHLWDTRTHRLLRTFAGHSGATRGLAFLSGGRELISAGLDRTVRIWDVATGQETSAIPHISEVVSLAVAPEDRFVAWGDEGGLAHVLERATGQTRPLLGGNHGVVQAVVFSPDGRTLATAGDDRLIRLWDPVTGSELLVLRGHAQAIHGLAFSPRGDVLASAGHDGAVNLWRAATPKPPADLCGR